MHGWCRRFTYHCSNPLLQCCTNSLLLIGTTWIGLFAPFGPNIFGPLRVPNLLPLVQHYDTSSTTNCHPNETFFYDRVKRSFPQKAKLWHTIHTFIVNFVWALSFFTSDGPCFSNSQQFISNDCKILVHRWTTWIKCPC